MSLGFSPHRRLEAVRRALRAPKTSGKLKIKDFCPLGMTLFDIP